MLHAITEERRREERDINTTYLYSTTTAAKDETKNEIMWCGQFPYSFCRQLLYIQMFVMVFARW